MIRRIIRTKAKPKPTGLEMRIRVLQSGVAWAQRMADDPHPVLRANGIIVLAFWQQGLQRAIKEREDGLQ